MLPSYQPLPTSPSSKPHKSKIYGPLCSKASLRWTILTSSIVLVLFFFWDPVLRPILTIWEHGPSRPSHIMYEAVRKPLPPTPEEQRMWDGRKQEVKDAFVHAWNGYRMKAFPADELLSVSGDQSNKFNGWGVTLFDSLDTMWIMGLHDDFSAAVLSVRDWHFKNITKPEVQSRYGQGQFIPFFETTIRYLGGLLSAFALSGNPILLELADQVGEILLPTFNQTKSGLPAFSVDLKTGKQDGQHETLLFAEGTSCQLEFKYLAKLTGKKEYYERVQAAMEVFYRANVTDGLFADNWYLESGFPRGNHLTVGGGSDSGYEYFLKQWVMSGDEQARQQYLKSVDGILESLIFVTPVRGFMYVTDKDSPMMMHRQEHLSCFLPAVLALGTFLLDLPPDVKEKHDWAATGLATTCAVIYADQESGLGPDEVRMHTDGLPWMDEIRKWEAGGRVGVPPGLSDPVPEKNATLRDYSNGWVSQYLLRPETVESIFYMWRTTGDVKWRERGYEIFKSINNNTRTKYGFSSISNIDGGSIMYLDDMPSYFLAETLKYLYLLFDDVDSFSLDTWVFNTEAHPLPVFSWTDEERAAFNITL